MLFTLDDLKMIITWATWKTSVSLGIISANEPYIPDDAIELLSRSKGHKDALVKFATAYINWYSFHLDIYKNNKSGKLSQEETKELDKLIDQRDNAKKTLMDITAT